MNEQENDLQDIKLELQEVKTLLMKLPETIDLKLRVYDEKISVINHRIKDLEDTNKWMWRAIAGAIIAGIVAMYLR